MIWLVMTAYQSNAALSIFLSIFKLYLNYCVFSIKICYISSTFAFDNFDNVKMNQSLLFGIEIQISLKFSFIGKG